MFLQARFNYLVENEMSYVAVICICATFLTGEGKKKMENPDNKM